MPVEIPVDACTRVQGDWVPCLRGGLGRGREERGREGERERGREGEREGEREREREHEAATHASDREKLRAEREHASTWVRVPAGSGRSCTGTEESHLSPSPRNPTTCAPPTLHHRYPT
jgi:hypothetical protein